MARFYISILFLVLAHTLAAQKVAVVLSGGGAKGLAHVGVLKALEEHDIPVDYVVGTSMGGVIGGCYAAGFSPERIDSLVTSPAFLGWVNGEFGDQYNYYYNRQDPDGAALSISIALDSATGAKFNSTLADDLSLNFALTEYLAQPSAKAGYDFNNLFVPFRAVAADVFTQTVVALEDGNLSDALRATLSVPFFYKPIKIKNKYLFDGGVYENFPVEVARNEFNPDVVIGVNVSSKTFTEYPYDKDDELVANSLLFMLLDKSDTEALGEKDIYIEPDLREFTAFDFAKARSLVDSGYVWAIRHMDEIKKKIKARATKEKVSGQRESFNQAVRPLTFSDIKLHGFNSKQQKYIRRIFRIKDKTLSLDDIKKGYYRLVSEEYFNTVYPRMTFNESTRNYDFELFKRPQNNFSLGFGGSIASRSISQMFLGFEFYKFDNYLLKTGVSFYAGNFYKSAQLRAKLKLPTLRQVYIEPVLTFNSWDFIDSEDFFFEAGRPTVLERIDRSNRLNVGMPLGSKYKLVFSSSYMSNKDEFSNNPTFISSDTLDQLNLTGFQFGLDISSNTLNKKQFANAGKALSFKLDYFNLLERYQPGSTSLVATGIRTDRSWFRAKISTEQYFNAGKYKPGYFFEAVASNQPFFSNYFGSLVNAPAFYPLIDSRTLFLQNFRGFSYAAIGMRNVLTVKPNFDLRLEGYLFKPFDRIIESESQVPSSDNFISRAFFAGTLAGVYHSPIGPISVNFNYYDDPESDFGVLVNVGYLIFNKTPLD
ncbi:MAG: patatin-like phospholipase family protein [Bacteroidota bacterium]